MSHPIPRYRFGAKSSAPFPVHLTAFVMYLVGLVSALAGAAVWAVGQGAAGTADGLPPALVDGGTPAAAALAVHAACWWLVARCLQTGRRWARILVLVLSGTSLVALVASVVVAGPGPATVAPLVLPAAFLVLLNLTASRSWFRYGRY